MKNLAILIATLLLIQSTIRAEEPRRFITQADWHGAEFYDPPTSYPGGAECNIASFKMLSENYCGEHVMLPGDCNCGDWTQELFIMRFNPALNRAEDILRAGELCYTGMEGTLEGSKLGRLLTGR